MAGTRLWSRVLKKTWSTCTIQGDWRMCDRKLLYSLLQTWYITLFLLRYCTFKIRCIPSLNPEVTAVLSECGWGGAKLERIGNKSKMLHKDFDKQSIRRIDVGCAFNRDSESQYASFFIAADLNFAHFLLLFFLKTYHISALWCNGNTWKTRLIKQDCRMNALWIIGRSVLSITHDYE